MSLPIERQDECPVCDRTYRELDTRLLTAADAERDHYVVAVGNWWLDHNLALHAGDPRPLMETIKRAFEEHGITMTTVVTQGGGQP